MGSISPKSKMFTQIYGRDCWCVYAYMGEAPDNKIVVKIGVSNNPFRRVNVLSTGMPFHAIMIWSKVGSKSITYKTEKALHKRFAEFKTRGEWFMFDKTDKGVFKDRLNSVFTAMTGQPPQWNHIDDRCPGMPKEIEEGNANREKVFWRGSECDYCGAPLLKGGRRSHCDDDCEARAKLENGE